MRITAVVEGVPDLAFEVRRYRMRGEAHAGGVMRELTPQPGDNYTLWRTATRDYREWFIAFCAPIHDEADQAKVDGLIAALEERGADDNITEKDAFPLVHRRLNRGLEDLAAGRVTAEGSVGGESHFGSRRGAELDVRTGRLHLRRQDG